MRTFFEQGRGFFRCGRPHFLEQKNYTDKGVEPVRTTFCRQRGGGQFFCVFVWTSFMDGLLLQTS